MRRDRWHELDVRSHGRDDGAAVRHVEPHDRSDRAFAWIGLGPAPDRAPLTSRQGHHRRFRTAEAAKVAVDRAWP